LVSGLLEPAAGFRWTRPGGLGAFNQVAGLVIETGELLEIAAFGFGVGRQVSEPLFFRPAAGGGKITVGITRRYNPWQHLAGVVQAGLEARRGILAESFLKFMLPDFGRRVRVVTDAAKDLEEMPIALKFVIVIAIRR